MQKVNIADLVAVPSLKNYYTTQPIDELLNSIQSEGQKTKVVVSPQMEIIDGYRIVDVLNQLGIETVEIEFVETDDLLKERIARNTYRIKTEEDQVEEVRTILKSTPKSQGKKEEGISRAQKRVIALGHKWQDEDTINKVEFIMDNDFENKILSKAVVMKNQSVESCYEFLKKFKSIDEENNYGFSQLVQTSSLSVKDANKLIESKHFLNNEYQDTFVIPEVGSSYNMDCTDLGDIEKHKQTCDLLFTSPPYFILRKYQNGDVNQVGHEETKDEYCNRIADIIGKVVPTLKDTANVMINIGETYDDGVGYGIPQGLKDAIEKRTRLIYKDQLVWSKPNPKPQNESIKRPINNLEYLLWFVVDPKKAKYNMLTYTLGDKGTNISYGAKDVDKDGKVWDKNISLTKPYTKIYSHIKEQEIAKVIEAKTGKNTDVYSIYKEGHPAIMCGVLPVVPILMTTDEEDTVADCFAGSNVVGRMSILLNRKFLSAELSNHYFKIGCRMLENATKDFNREELDVINGLAYPDNQQTIKNPNNMESTTNQDNIEFVYPEVISSKIKKDAGILTPEEITNTYWPEDVDTKENSVDIPKVEIGEGSFIYNGNNIDVLKSLPDNSIDSAVTDPPYGISFMGKKWDYDVPTVEFWKEVLRVLKPGGHVLSFSSARTYHKMTARIEDAGFEIRDQIMWIYGSGMPKSHNVALSIDKSLGFPNRGHRIAVASRYHPDGTYEPNEESIASYEPKSEEAKKWKNWGTGLKPSHEPIVVARKPLSEKTYAKNVLKWGTSSLNIGGCRVGEDIIKTIGYGKTGFVATENFIPTSHIGRWPANIMFDDEASSFLDLQEKNASRFFYVAKATKKDKEEGLEAFAVKKIEGSDSGKDERNVPINNITSLKSNTHPTVKPTELMQYLVRLVTPPNGITIDPYFGSGSTGKACIREGFRFIGIEQSKEYFNIAVARCEYEQNKQNPIQELTYSLN